MTNSVILQQSPAVITRTIDGEVVIMDPQKGKVLSLNEVGTLIWEKADGRHTKAEILSAICSEFDVSHDIAATDLDEFIAILKDKDLLTVK